MIKPNRSGSAATKHHNRVAAILIHTSRYGFRGPSRLARDAGFSRSTICRIIHGKVKPRYSTARQIVKCLEVAVGHPLHRSEVFSDDGWYPTGYVCELLGCPNCLPDWVYEEDGSRRPSSAEIQSGTWTGDSVEMLTVTGKHPAC